MLRNIPDDKEYSELTRTFNLVEPLMVFEDMRLNGASRPFDRFNEHLEERGKVTTQPAWENFNVAWKSMTQGMLLDQPIIKADTWAMNYISDSHKMLIATKVDGTPLNSQYSDWDRSKYTTFISDADWNEWKMPGSRADAFSKSKIRTAATT
jgi:hypothetical protein